MKTNIRKEIMIFVLGALMILCFALCMSTPAHAEGLPEPQYFSEPSLAWVTSWRTSIRPEPKAEGRYDYLYNGQYMTVIGTITANGDTFAIVPLRSININQDGYGYVSAHTIKFGPKTYVTNYYGAWVYCAPSEAVPCVGQLVAEETRMVLAEVTDAQGNTWYAIQIDNESRGSGFVRKDWVCEPFSTSEDLAFEQQMKATYRVYLPSAPVVVEQPPQNATIIVVAPDGTQHYARRPIAGETATISRATLVFSAGSNTSPVLGGMNIGETVYVYQVNGEYAQIWYNNQYGYVAINDMVVY